MAQVIAPPDAEAEAEDSTYYELPVEQVAASFDVDPARGLSVPEAAARLDQYGANKFAEAKAEPWWRVFVCQYYDAMQIVLLVAGIASIVPLGQYGTGIMLLLLTVLNAVLGLHQEGKAAAAVAALQKMMIIKAKVHRGGQLAEIPAEQLVPGDVVSIEAGDLVPADGRLLEAATLEVAESALTGESMPVAKGLETVADPETPLGDRTDMVYMNTNVTRGSGRLVVTATGTATELTIPGRRYTVSGSGYSIEGKIMYAAGQPEVPLEQFLLPMTLASDAVVHDGEMIGDPTEGALVVLAEKGGLDADATREAY